MKVSADAADSNVVLAVFFSIKIYNVNEVFFPL